MGPRKGECLGGHPSHELAVAGMSASSLDFAEDSPSLHRRGKGRFTESVGLGICGS